MTICLCPGIHAPQLTREFAAAIGLSAPKVAPGSPFAIADLLSFLDGAIASTEPLTFIAFSAGVVGAIGAAPLWQQRGGIVRSLLAFDGWGVPLAGTYPQHRFSHDRFTAWSSTLLGAGDDLFFCDPPVPHLDLWRSPHTARGWHVPRPGWHHRTTAADLTRSLLARYGENLN
ncbi:hypothetical protein KR51_00030570 [Rubidibacter lacunae KORDI 51-2]|uniref:Alpha/beta hydrolase n=1 Tax=Rubidibacter lacunae KORDI 51-2 TaxID=582515 RepID=U5DLB5_9CHRO|nr:hypothetical protein [Rubidibacter lacunae]ERN40510.1 hypothetical protein KR51_00030570 [Rubidibacter lacunae KORDI 51-2]